MSNTLFISIIIPTYNVEKYITRCLESCINQTFSNIEILVVDDCGNDNSINIAQDFANKDSRIRIIHNSKNLGTFNARIEGIKNAKGEYILCLDADDYIDTKCCEILHNTIMQEQDLPDIVMFGMRFDPPTLKCITPPVITKKLYNEEILKAVFTNYTTPPWHIWAKLYKASHIMRICNIIVAHMGDSLHLNMAEDVLKSFIVVALAKKSIGISDKLYAYCNNKSSITRKIDITTAKKKIADLDNVIAYLDTISSIDEIKTHKFYKISKIKTQNILKATKELEYRYLSADEISTIRGGAA